MLLPDFEQVMLNDHSIPYIFFNGNEHITYINTHSIE